MPRAPRPCRHRAGAAALVSFLGCVTLFVSVTGWVRGAVGDVLVVVLLVASLAVVPLGTPRTRVGGVLAFAFVVEGLQTLKLVGPDSHWLLHATLGSTFDPVDLAMYVLGAAIAWGAERWWGYQAASGPP